MAISKYSFEQKVEFCKEYHEKSGHSGIIFAEKMAAWLNKEKHLDPPLQGYDFRRPDDIRQFLDRINNEIRMSVKSSEGVIHVMSTPQINAEHILKKCRTRSALQEELQKINKRFSDLIETNHKLASALKTEHEECEKYKQKAEAAETNLRRMEKERSAEIKKVREELKKEKDENYRVRKINRDLLKYIQRYISDPIVYKHVSEELMLLNTDPNTKIELPESIREMIGLTNLEDVIRRCSCWDEELFEDAGPTDDDKEDEDAEEVSESDLSELDHDDYEIISEAEAEIRRRLNNL